MTNAYVIDRNSIKLPKEVSEKLKLKEGMELKVISDEVDGVLILKVVEGKNKDSLVLRALVKSCGKILTLRNTLPRRETNGTK